MLYTYWPSFIKWVLGTGADLGVILGQIIYALACLASKLGTGTGT